MRIVDTALEIVALNKSILNIYEKIAELEINNNMNSKELKEYKDFIKIYLEILRKKYRLLSDKGEELISFNNNFGALITREENDVYLDAIVNEYSNLKSIKACTIIYDICETYNIFSKRGNISEEIDVEEYVNNKIINTIQLYGFDSLDKDPDDFDDVYMSEVDASKIFEATAAESRLMYKVASEKEKILVHMFKHYLDEEIKNTENELIRNELIRYKYKLIFSSLDLEYDFVYNYDNDIEKNIISFNREYNINQEYFELFYYDLFKYDIERLIELLSESRKHSLINEKMIVRDILLHLYLKSLISIIVNEKDLKEAKKRKKETLKVIKSKYAKNIIKESFKIEENLSLTRVNKIK